MTFVNDLLTRAFALVMGPMGAFPVPATLGLLSFVTATSVLVITYATSNKKAIGAVERQMYADLLEMRLFRDDLRAMGRAMWEMCRHNFTYVRLALVPALVSFLFLAPVMGQLQSYFGYSAVPNGQPVIVAADLKPGVHVSDVALTVPPRVHIESPAIWFPALRQVAWRVVVDSPGEYVLGVHIGGTTYDKTLDLSDTLVRRSPLRPGGRLADQLLNPLERPLPDSAPVASIRVTYPKRHIDVLGAQMDWVGPFIALSILFALVLKHVGRRLFLVALASARIAWPPRSRT